MQPTKMQIVVHHRNFTETQSRYANPRWRFFLGNTVKYQGGEHLVKAVGREGFAPTVHLLQMRQPLT
ncbi:MAG: hypothetical protein GY906_24950 [bacterium]|nr:hypothetical protein [bacterium]